MSNWPNLFIAGAPRCGTSSLHAHLQSIPGIYMSRIKEPNFFSRSVIGIDHPMVRPIRNEQQYLQLFRGAGNSKVVGEATPFYLEDPAAPSLINRVAPDARVIVSLRDPVERLHSHYLMMRNNLPAIGSFIDEIKRGIAFEGNRNLALLTPSTGLYGRQVERYLQVFGEDRFEVLILEEWSRDVRATIRQIVDFLDVEHEVDEIANLPQRKYAEARGPLVRFLFGNRTISRMSEALIPFQLRKRVRNALLVRHVQKPEMDAAAREFLIDYYRHDVRFLEELLGRRLPWRNFAVAAPVRARGRYRMLEQRS